MSLESDLAELRAQLELRHGDHTLVLVVVPSDAQLDEVKRPLLELLRATPLPLADLGACTTSIGPAQWAELARARDDAAVHVLSFTPATDVAARAFAKLLNAERGLLRLLPAPLLLLVSAQTERVLRRSAHDFFTWVSHAYAMPEPRELLVLAARLGVAAAEPAAPAEPPIRFLHVSDFHLRPARIARYGQDLVLDGLVGFLERDRAEFPLDLVFVTGDLAFSGKPEEYVLVVELLRRLLAATGVPPERLFVVPGNHDVDRGVGRWLLRTLASNDDATAFFVEPDGRAFHRRKLEAYETGLRQLVGPGRSLGLEVGADAVEVVEVAGTRLAVVSFNSAWFSQGDGDQGKLWLGEPNVRAARRRIADVDAAFAISLVHHPFEYLHEDERESVESWFERGFDLVLRGHLHKNKTRSIASQRGGYVEVAAPASYQGSQWPNGCFLGEIRAKARTVRLRPYAFTSGPDPWVIDPKVFPDDADDGHCRTFAIPSKRQAKSGVSTAAHVAVQNAYEKATPYQKRHVEHQVYGEQAAVTAQHADHETVVRLAEESPELLKQILGNDDSGVLMVSTIEGLVDALPLPRIDVTEAGGFRRALEVAGRLFLAPSSRRTLSRSRVIERDALLGLATSLGAVVVTPMSIHPELRGGRRPHILIGGLDEHCASFLVEVIHISQTEIAKALQWLDQHLGQGSVRDAALAVAGSLPYAATEPRIDRVKTPDGHEVWLVHL